MLLRYLSETAQLVRVKLWNVFLGDFQTDTINVVLQNRKQNGQHTNKGWGQNKPISSYRVRPINLRLCDPLRGDSWYLKHINVANKSKNKRAERKRESVSQKFFKKIPFLLPRTSNEHRRTNSSISTMSHFAAGPKELQTNSPSSSLLYRLFMAEEAGLFKTGQGSQKRIRRRTMTSEGQSTPIPNSPFIYPPSI